MALADLADWLDEHARPDRLWYVKRLSGNDTLANGSHQAGPYVPKEALFALFPQLQKITDTNAKTEFDFYIDSHADHRRVVATWYNNRLRGGSRDEARLTNFGGAASALLDPESTGAIAVFAFVLGPDGAASSCHAWVTRDGTEQDAVEERIGPVEPGRWLLWSPVGGQAGLFEKKPPASCWLAPGDIPPAWLGAFPTGREIVGKAVAMRPDTGLDVDARLLRRRDCEYEIFRSLEEAVELPVITKGFTSIEEFVARAQTILQRRKARGGKSLELQARQIFIEEQLAEGEAFVAQPHLPGDGMPDFLFPSLAAYADMTRPAARLRVLAVKTTFRDRWRQVTREAKRIPVKHLLTLQEGVSETQFAEMTEAGVRLVVPRKLQASYPAAVRPHLMSLESFIGDVRLIAL